MIQNESHIGFVAYTQDRKHRKMPLGIVSQSDKQKAIATHYNKRIQEKLITIEDKRFFSHLGFDIISLSRALYINIKSLKIKQGGSTLTQQLARNLLEDNSITLRRKIKEILYALSLERHHSKNEILDLYLNNIYWGQHLYGIRAASLYYFSKEPRLLSQQEQLFLLTILRGPNYYIKHHDSCIKRYNLLNQILFEKGIINDNVYKHNKTWKYQFEYNKLSSIPPSIVPYITESINTQKSSILTSINHDLQKYISTAVEDSVYPISIVVLKDGKIIGINSSYGIEHPLTFRSNVGSTLKPFLYTFYRKNGIAIDETFNCQTITNDEIWAVKEAVQPDTQNLTLQEALFVSNNNTFINAANKVGMPKVLRFLADLLNKNLANIHPSSILGATSDGVSLFEITKLYADFFQKNDDPFKNECRQILFQIAEKKLNIKNLFLKTGTTNNSKEKFAILGNSKLVFGIMRHEKCTNEYTKEGGFLDFIKKFFQKVPNPEMMYKWI